MEGKEGESERKIKGVLYIYIFFLYKSKQEIKENSYSLIFSFFFLGAKQNLTLVRLDDGVSYLQL